MQVSVEITSGLGRRLTIGVPAARIESEVAARLEKAARTVRLKGFRQGKVPLKVVQQRFGAGVRQEVLDERVWTSVCLEGCFDITRPSLKRPAGSRMTWAKPAVSPGS